MPEDERIAAIKNLLPGLLIEYWGSNDITALGVPYRRMATEATDMAVKLLEQYDADQRRNTTE